MDGFLARHAPVARPRLLSVGSFLGEWRVTAFLGSGGNAEVYRVVSARDGRAAAAKVLLREDEASRRRFRQEVQLLAAQTDAAFARFYAAGETGGRPYLVTELLEPVDLPETESEIADYLLAVCRAVGVLHRAGRIHRDIKPSNVMRRADGELVLIDLGLVKDTARSPDPEPDVSLVSGKVIAVGTPRFAAPEQLSGGEVTAAADVHAIGRLADVAFRSHPPREWLPIILRATSSIPEQRYQSADALARAIRGRRGLRRTAGAAGAMLLALLLAVGGAALFRARTPSVSPSPSADLAVREHTAWNALCENAMTNLVASELLWERPVTNWFGGSCRVQPARAYRTVTNRVAASIIRLNGRKVAFARPVELSPSRAYFVEGPGVLDADFRSLGTNVVVHLNRCDFVNRSAVPVGRAGLRYVFDKDVYLNFPALDRPSRSASESCFENFDRASNVIRYKGPPARELLTRELELDRRKGLQSEREQLGD